VPFDRSSGTGIHTEARKRHVLDCVADHRRAHVGFPSTRHLLINTELPYNTIRELIRRLVDEGCREPWAPTWVADLLGEIIGLLRQCGHPEKVACASARQRRRRRKPAE
jgi:hypothetical protein